MNDPSIFQDMAILALKNTTVDLINEYMFSLIPSEEKIYLNFDTSVSTNPDVDGLNELHTPKLLNTIIVYGLTNHMLKLKVGVLVTLLRNIDQALGLCNGTRLIITTMSKYLLEGHVLFGSNIGNMAFNIGKMTLNYFVDNKNYFVEQFIVLRIYLSV